MTTFEKLKLNQLFVFCILFDHCWRNLKLKISSTTAHFCTGSSEKQARLGYLFHIYLFRYLLINFSNIRFIIHIREKIDHYCLIIRIYWTTFLTCLYLLYKDKHKPIWSIYLCWFINSLRSFLTHWTLKKIFSLKRVKKNLRVISI